MTPPPDQADRTLAWQRFDVSVNVTAGAGTGKTRVLVDRFLAWILGEGWRRAPKGASASTVASSILAITFTEKAAGEMQERVGRSLRALVGRSIDDEFEQRYIESLGREMADHFDVPLVTLQQRAEAMLAQAHRLEVSTIHSFAARVLRTWPLEASVHPDFDVDTEGLLRRKALRRAFVDATTAGLLGPEADRWARVVGTVGEATLLDLLTEMLDAGFDGTLPAPPDLGRFAERCRQLDETLAWLAPRAARGSLGKLRRLREALALAVEIANRPDIGGDPRNATTRDERARLVDLRKDLSNYPPRKLQAALGEQLPAFLETAQAVQRVLEDFRHADPGLLSDFAALYGPLIESVGAQLQAEGLLSFDDLLRLCEQLLSREPAVAHALAERYGQLLIDEFQDTNPAQCRLLSAIAGADPGNPRLFVVGDPKQSIYAFRQADLAAYEAFTARLGLTLELRASFRTQAHLLERMNAAFDRLFVATPGLQPGPQALAPTRDPRVGPALQLWDASDPAGGKRLADDARQVEARAIARQILDLDAREPAAEGKRWSRFAVLSRVQSEAATTVEVLEAAGIPCVVSGDKEFYRRQEVLDVANLLRVLLDPADAVAWVGLLRSPLGAVPDRVLVDLARAEFFAGKDPAGAARRAEHTAGPDEARHLRRITLLIGVLDELRGELLDGPVDRWLESLLHRLPLQALHASRYLGERKSANLLRVLRGFRDAAVSGAVPLGEWLEEVAQHLVGRHEESESALADDTTDAVRVMSIHASKGLQFDHVFVPRLDWHKSGGAADEVSCAPSASGEGFVLVARGRASWGVAAQRAAAARVEEAETLRLLYVACTRARETLTLIGLLGSARRSSMAASVRAGYGPDAEEVFAEEVLAEVPLAESARPELDRWAETLADAAPAWWRGAERRWNEARGEAAMHTASAAHVSRDPEADDAPADEEASLAPVADSREAAAALGIEVHRLLEVWDGGQPNLIGASEEAADLVRGFLASPLAEQVRRARRVLRELPFLGAGVVGQIDLVLETESGWLVVDYKTSRVASPAAARAAADRFREQAALYTRVVREALGTEDVRFEAWFVRGPWAVAL